MRFRADDQPAVLAQVEGGVLRVRGTVGDDRIVLRRNRRTGRVEIDGVAQTFDPATFSRVDVQALDGDDRVDLSALGLPATTDGGAGDDVILGSSAPDSILGGAGDDTLFGGRGADTLRGGDGNDYLGGGPGADQLFGDPGNDQVFAVDSARDTVDGGDGFDRVKADADDLLTNSEGLLA
jgi:Ca2+-binding RTX toxin-like protein